MECLRLVTAVADRNEGSLGDRRTSVERLPPNSNHFLAALPGAPGKSLRDLLREHVLRPDAYVVWTARGEEMTPPKSLTAILLTTAVGLVLTSLGFWVGPATAAQTEPVRPASIPRWVPPRVDHPVPATNALPPALTNASPAPGTVVTPEQAETILTALWSLRDLAFQDDDRSLMAEFESGPALESDEVTCGCNYRATRGPIEGESLLVPKQATLPASFLAEVQTTLLDGPYVQYLVIARQSQATPWKVVADPGEPGHRPLDLPQVGPGGFDVAATPTPSAAAQLPGDLASYWRTWTDRGHAPVRAPLAPGRWTTQAGADFARHPSGSLDVHNGLIGYDAFQGGGTNEEWSFGTAAGSVTCGVVRWQVVWTDPGGGPRQDPARQNWGPSVTPGVYRYMADTEIMQPCFVQRVGAATMVTSGVADPDTMEGVGTANSAGFGIALAIVLILWFAVAIGSFAMMIVALVDIARRPEWQWKLAGQEKILWILLVVLVNVFAIPSLIYWFNIRKKLVAVADAAASGRFGPGQMTYAGWEPVPTPTVQPAPTVYSGTPPAGWYTDPSTAGLLRWWDGARWTAHTSPWGPTAGERRD